MIDYLEQLRGAVEAVQIYSATGFSWFGKGSARLIPRIAREITPRTARSFLQYTLQSRLYSHFYCTGRAIPARDEEHAWRPGGAAWFVGRLSEANSGRGTWSEGWEAVAMAGLGPGLVAAGRAGLVLLAGEGEYRQEGEGKDKRLLLRFGKDLPSVSPGFHMAVSDVDFDKEGEASDPGGLVRLYWHLSPEGAVRLMRHCTGALNGAGIPFKLKALNDPERFDRCDSAVLYFHKRHFAEVAPLISAVYREVQGEMREAVPAFTLALAPGLGLAEDPGGGDSFGLHRCGLVADGLIKAYEAGRGTTEERLTMVVERLEEDGISIEHPYVAGKDGGNYELRITNYDGEKRDEGGAKREAQKGERAALSVEDVAGVIARQLAMEAIRYEGMCNWMGTEVRVERGTRTEEWSTLGPDLYTGTAGVGLFLAEYGAATGDREAKETALGAFRHAFFKSESIEVGARPGLYTGWTGLALAAARAGRALGEEGLVEKGLALARRCALEEHPGHEHDLLGGSAGAVVGCLALREMTGEGFLLDYAVALGDDLLGAARKVRGGGLAWAAVNNKLAAPLMGFSHGAAGIGYALHELWRVTGEERFRMGTAGAFKYEARWFNPKLGNWPDFREIGPPRGKDNGKALEYTTYWCHGAPGVALSRLRAFEMAGEGVMLEAHIATRTTAQAVRSELTAAGSSYSLCHGLSGNAGVLLRAAEAGVGDGADLAWEVAHEGVQRYKANGWWACGTGGRPGAQAPGLLLGLAGIGHFYLRLKQTSVPSVLLVEPEKWNV